MKNNILFVGGTWDLNNGKESKIVNEFSKYIPNVKLYNGGNYDDLNKVLESVINYKIVLWWANVSNDLPKIRNIKEINYKAMLVSSKRNIDNKYTFNELIEKSLEQKSNLTIEFSNIKENNLYKMRLFDPLGNLYYEGENIEKCAESLLERLNYIINVTRESTIQIKNNIIIPQVKKEFIKIIRKYSNTFIEKIYNTKRFLGNASFRCTKGFPSFREKDYIFVSRRNVNKKYIDTKDFVPVFSKNNKIFYLGENKPSVDTPIQVRLYNLFPNINYMIHSHCYIKNAPFTVNKVPCGALEEVEEVRQLICKYYNNDFNKKLYTINLIGHGSIIMSSNIKQFNNVEIVKRNIPEK